MGGTCNTDASNSEIAAAVLTIPQNLTTENMTGTIIYEYHSHETACSQTGTCGGHIRLNRVPQADGSELQNPICTSCGYIWGGSALDLVGTSCTRQVTKYTCGYTDGQLISATITF